jgi:hypothetical protein
VDDGCGYRSRVVITTPAVSAEEFAIDIMSLAVHPLS